MAALAYFDVFEYPLTLMELKRWRWSASGEPAHETEPSPNEILAAIKTLPVGEEDGHYFLAGREALVAERHRRYRLAEKKFRKARRFACWLRHLPSVRLIAVCNSLAYANSVEESDIDFFIVCRPGTLWATRFVAAGALKLLNLRPTPERQADRFCLSFFATEDALDLSRLAISSGDAYLRYWIATLAPLYDAGNAMAKFWAANAWIRERLPGVYLVESGPRRALKPVYQCRVLLWLLRRFETAAKRFQAKRFPKEIAALANRDSRVVVNDQMLKFHVNDRRADYEKLFRERLARRGIVSS